MTRLANIWVIDDDPTNLKLVRIFLEGTNHKLQTFECAEAAWDRLLTQHQTVDVIVLDRVMPGLDGMSFLKRAKAHEHICDIPVIMQTVEAKADQVAAGIDSGVHYYLAKPYDKAVLRSVIDAAADFYTSAKQMKHSVDQFALLSTCMEKGTFRFRTIEDAMSLARGLSRLFPDSAKIVTGLSELMINAVEHGNLGISYAEKSQLLLDHRWKEEINLRLASEEYSDKRARIDVDVAEHYVEARISDEGKGFDWPKYLDPDPERMLDDHGRGILIAKGMSFDSLEYSKSGTCVTVRCNRSG